MLCVGRKLIQKSLSLSDTLACLSVGCVVLAITTEKKKIYSHLSGGLCCCIVSVFGSGGKLAVFLLWREIFITGSGNYDRKKNKIQSSVWRVVLLY